MAAMPPDLRHQDPIIQRLLDWLRGFAATFVADTVTAIFGAAGIKIRWGVEAGGTANAWTWNGTGVVSQTMTITHGLGKTPAVTFIQAGSSGHLISHAALNRNTTTFQTVARRNDGVTPAADSSIGYFWLALG